MKIVIFLIMMVITSVANGAHTPIKLEARTGAGIPEEDFAGLDLNASLGLEGTIAYQLTSTLGVYAGWGWHQFDTDVTDVYVEESGYTLGFQLSYPALIRNLDVRVRAGLTIEYIELENNQDDLIEETSYGTGYEIGLAIPIDINALWEATPGICYRYLSSDISINGQSEEVDLSFIAIDLGVTWNF